MEPSSKEKTEPLRGVFPDNPVFTNSTKKKPKDASFSSKFCGLANKDEILKRFKVILNNGQLFSISYSTLPTFILIDNTRLYIQAYELQISIEGRGLSNLEHYLTLEQVRWMSESRSTIDDPKNELHIRKIKLSGKAVTITENH